MRGDNKDFIHSDHEQVSWRCSVDYVMDISAPKTGISRVSGNILDFRKGLCIKELLLSLERLYSRQETHFSGGKKRQNHGAVSYRGRY